MNLPISVFELSLYYFVPIITLLFLYGLGRGIKYVLFNRIEELSAYSIIASSILGLTAFVIIYSIIMTKGLTVNWILLGLFLIYCFTCKKCSFNNLKLHTTSSWKVYLLIVFLINTIFYIYYVYRIIDFDKGAFSPYFCDLDYYAKVSQYLNKGYENGLLEYNFFKYIAPQPYHYFELWTNAFLYKIFGLNAVITYMVSMPMLFNILIFFSLLAVVEIRKKISWMYLGLVLTAFLMVDVISYLSEFVSLIKGSTYRLNYPKMLPVIMFFQMAVVTYLYGKKKYSYYLLLAIPILNIILLVGVWGTIGIFLFWYTYKVKFVDWKLWLPYFFVIVCYLLYILQSSSRSTHWGEPFHWNLFRLYITQPILYILAYIHFIIGIIIIGWKDRKNVALNPLLNIGYVYGILCFITITVSIIMRPYNYDATQFISGTLPIFMYTLLSVTFLIMVTKQEFSAHKKIFLFCFCGSSLWFTCKVYNKDLVPLNSMNLEYESTIVKFLPEQDEYRIGFYIGEHIRLGEGGNYVSGVVDAITFPDALDYYYNNVIHYSINKGNNDAEWSTDHTPYRDYYAKSKVSSSDISDDEIRINFIIENRIEYIRILKSAKPSEYFLSHLSLLVEDVENGECFYKVVE
ncbi:hypothetical protein [Parabacteroides chinchillae]|uniref:Uncharacterized protein n=1 Tax=Parabacteroides chinchillae TaxID=871327 RepID=A0A8G2BXL7_9BACT|nr:hypothetical protein [Parabacteroides chinchillae]SEF99067.1 hypothetical protein SAMN05444001_11163 [Parabacteroides chinchillae]